MIIKNKSWIVIIFLLFLTFAFALENDSLTGIVVIDLPNETTLPVPNETQQLPEENLSTNETGQSLIVEPKVTMLEIIIDRVSVFIGEVVNIQAILKFENETPLPDQKIDFYADKYIGSDTTDIEGKAEIKWNTSAWLPNVYTVTANYSGDEQLSPSSAVVEPFILKTEVINTTNFSDENSKLLFISTKEKSVEEYRQILNNATNKGDAYALIQYENNSIKHEVLTPNGQDFILTRHRAKSTEIYDTNQLIFREYWTVYKNMSRDLSNQFGRTTHKIMFKPSTYNYIENKNDITLLNTLHGVDGESRQDIGDFNKKITIQNQTYIYTITLNGTFSEYHLLWTVYQPYLGINFQELDCKFTIGNFAFDVCDNDLEFITQFDDELLFGFGAVGENKEVTIRVTKI